jgi:hypothetical protein
MAYGTHRISSSNARVEYFGSTFALKVRLEVTRVSFTGQQKVTVITSISVGCARAPNYSAVTKLLLVCHFLEDI